MDSEHRDALRERNRQRAYGCPKCGAWSLHELSEEEVARRDDTFPGVRYRQCGGCGHTFPVKRGKG